MYHERQSRQYCLVHALNALLQRKEWTATTLDEICYSLNDSRWFNPHRFVFSSFFFSLNFFYSTMFIYRSWFGLGNYDVNVLMAALSLSDLQVSKCEFILCLFV